MEMAMHQQPTFLINMQSISIVIPNYNGAHLLRRNLPSVQRAAAAYNGQAEIIVVDDGSSDDSLQVLETDFPMVRIVSHQRNMGFAEAVHSGVNASNTELLFLLNSDVELEEKIFEPLVKYFDEPETFSVCPLMLDEKREINRHSWNLRRLVKGRLKIMEWGLSSAKTRRQLSWLPTMYASGGSMMVRKSMFVELHGFHPIFKPFYSEDYDLGMRAWRRGWPSYFEPNVHVIHQKHGSIRDNFKINRIKCIRRRNRYLLEWIHLPTSKLWLSAIPSTFLQLVGEVILLDHTNIKGFILALMKIPEVLSARKDIERHACLSLNQVLDKLES